MGKGAENEGGEGGVPNTPQMPLYIKCTKHALYAQYATHIYAPNAPHMLHTPRASYTPGHASRTPHACMYVPSCASYNLKHAAHAPKMHHTQPTYAPI